ncbi:MAG: hypothetical protein HY508_06905 [Acidobacteria bacterium]|nr:hypothetical protein [Acidobacteriota bacterium]
MDSGNSSVKTLLYIVLVLALLAVGSNFYVASLLDRNSQELASLRLLLQKQMMGTALTQVEEMQKKLDAMNQSASGIDAKMKKAQDDFVIRMNKELPLMMDRYIQQRAGKYQPMIPQDVKEKIQQQVPK